MASHYEISEQFFTLQGEGGHTGLPCVFLRAARCNLWPDPEKPSKTCPWCDTPQLHQGVKLTFETIASRLRVLKGGRRNIGCVLSGGEPFLQLDKPLLQLLSAEFQWVDIETNGTVKPHESILDHKPSNVYVSCSPKTDKVALNNRWSPAWFKVIVPDKAHLLPGIQERYPTTRIYLQPCAPSDGGVESEQYKKNLEEAKKIALFEGFGLSVQQHKFLDLR